MSDLVTQFATDVLDYLIDWSAFLALTPGDTIASSTWTASGVVASSESATSTSTTVWLSGGTGGVTYRATNSISTTQGREKSFTFFIEIQEM